MKVIARAVSMSVVVLLSGCISLKVESGNEPSCLNMKGLANGYATVSALHPYRGTILDFGLLSESHRPGEIMSLDVWPLCGIGVGVVGARVRLLPVEVGLGVLWYDPKPEATAPSRPGRIEGSGHVAKEDRPVSDFSRISVHGAGELNITQGDRESLSIEADDNLLPLIEARVSDGTLSIGPKDHREFHAGQPIRFNLSVRKLEGITLSGACAVRAPSLSGDKMDIAVSGSGKITVDALSVNALTVRISGSGDCDIAGQADSQTIRVSGSGKYAAGKLESQSADVDISGSGNVFLWAKETLNVKVRGSGHVSYYGSPHLTQTSAGQSTITSLGNAKEDKP